MSYCYFPAFKTRDSELRAYNKLNDSVKNKKEAGMFFSEIKKKERDEIFNLYENFDFKEL